MAELTNPQPPEPTAPAASGDQEPPSREELARSSGYRSRFTAIYVALAIILGAAGAIFVIEALSPESTPKLPPAWSAFVPDGQTTEARARQIAAHVGPRYKLPDGTVMTATIPGPPTVTSNQAEGSTQILVRAIAVRPSVPAGGELGQGDVEVTDSVNTVQYLLCGEGQNCSIARGSPSEARHLLLRREAIELALFTFRYLPRVGSVVVYLPSRPAAENVAGELVFLRRGDVATLLAQPLTETFDPVTPTVGTMTDRENELVNLLTLERLYRYSFTQAQDGGAILLLDPVRTG